MPSSIDRVAMQYHGYRLAVVDPLSLPGQELLRLLAEAEPQPEVALLGESERVGTPIEYGDDTHIVGALDASAIAGSPARTCIARLAPGSAARRLNQGTELASRRRRLQSSVHGIQLAEQ